MHGVAALSLQTAQKASGTPHHSAALTHRASAEWSIQRPRARHPPGTTVRGWNREPAGVGAFGNVRNAKLSEQTVRRFGAGRIA